MVNQPINSTNMFNNSKYTRWYYQIITRAQDRALTNDSYTEVHHIVPKSLGGNNLKDNLVNLTGREHIAKRICAGEKNGMYGKKLTPEMIARRTASLKANKLAKKLALGV